MPIDPCFAELLADPRNIVRPPPPHVAMEKVRRAADAAMVQGDAPRMADLSDRIVHLPARDIRFRHYRPNEAPVLPAILFCHGGGYVWGSIETHDGICRRLAAQTEAAVISVDYRLAPETQFPGPVEDAFGVLHEIITNADAYGVDPANIALCGDSAGGGICVSLAKLASRHAIPLSHLALIYPALDPSCDSASQHALANGPLLTQEAMRWFWSCYLGTPQDPAAETLPLHEAYLEGFPPTTIATAEYDPLKDEGEALASGLKAHGIDLAFECFPGMIHGFLSLPTSSPTTKAAFDYVSARLRAAFGPRPQSRKF
jgi:acetyl esterase